MPGLILGFSSILQRPADEPMLVVWNDMGLRYGVALRIPSARRDIVKLKLISITSHGSEEIRLQVHPDTRELTDGKFNYEVREPGSDSEVESCLKVVEINKQQEGEE